MFTCMCVQFFSGAITVVMTCTTSQLCQLLWITTAKRKNMRKELLDMLDDVLKKLFQKDFSWSCTSVPKLCPVMFKWICQPSTLKTQQFINENPYEPFTSRMNICEQIRFAPRSHLEHVFFFLTMSSSFKL